MKFITLANKILNIILWTDKFQTTPLENVLFLEPQVDMIKLTPNCLVTQEVTSKYTDKKHNSKPISKAAG